MIKAQFWSPKATRCTSPSRSLNSISKVDANVIWENTFDNSDPNNQDFTVKEFTLSIDGGNTWTFVKITLGANTTDMESSTISAVSASTAWISVSPGATSTAGIWKTIDEGRTWTKQATALFSSINSYPNFVHFWNATDGTAQGDPESNEFEIYTTTNGGTNWTRVPAANIPNPLLGELGYFNLYTVSGNTIWFGTDKGRIFRSSDIGSTWTVFASVYSANFRLDRFTFASTTKGILMINDILKIYSSADGGETWNPITTSSFYNTKISYILGTSNVIPDAKANPLGSYYSTTDGITSTKIDALDQGTTVFSNNSFRFSAGKNTSTTAEGIDKFDGVPLKNASLGINNKISAYPNPTYDILYLNSENSLIKETLIFDLLGRRVFLAEFLPVNKVDLDLKSLQSGTYILKVTSDSGTTETLKIMKK